MPEYLKTILVSVLASTVFSGALVWLLQTWISERIKKAIEYEYAEKLKALEHGYDQQLEKLRAQLQSESLKAKEEIEHDKKLFEKLTSYCDEATVRDVCNSITDAQFYDRSEFGRLRDLGRYGIQDENQFVNSDLRAAFLRFHGLLGEFTTLVVRHFFNKGDNRFMLYPELRNSGDEKERGRFEAARTATEEAGDKVLEAFSDFRQAVKRTLYV